MSWSRNSRSAAACLAGMASASLRRSSRFFTRSRNPQNHSMMIMGK
jgi:hypothetical protein